MIKRFGLLGILGLKDQNLRVENEYLIVNIT